MKIKFILPILAALIFAGCVGQTRWEAAETQKNLALVKPGMSVEQVTSLLGPPRDREFVPAKGRPYNIVRYQTKFSGDAVFIAPDEEDMTPFVFVDGKLIGWGKTYYQTLAGTLKLQP